MTTNELTEAEVDARLAELERRAGISPGWTCEEIAALSAGSGFDLIGSVRGKFADAPADS